MQKELLFQEIIDKNILSINDLFDIANIPSTETFVKGNLTCWKKLVDEKHRDCGNVIFSDYFSYDDCDNENGMFLIYASLLKKIKTKIKNQNLDNEMFSKLNQYLDDVISYDWSFDYECEDINAWIIKTMNQFEMYITKIHASFINNLWNYLKHITNNQYQNHDIHLKSIQDYLYFNVDMIPSITKYKLEDIDNFVQDCEYVLDWIDAFVSKDINYQAIIKMDLNYDIDLYKSINLGKISLIYREIKIFKVWYKILNEKKWNAEIYKDANYMLKNIGLFLFLTINEIIAKPNINL